MHKRLLAIALSCRTGPLCGTRGRRGPTYVGIISKGMLLRALDREGVKMADQNNPWDTTPAADSAAQSQTPGVHRRLHRPTAVALTGDQYACAKRRAF